MRIAPVFEQLSNKFPQADFLKVLVAFNISVACFPKNLWTYVPLSAVKLTISPNQKFPIDAVFLTDSFNRQIWQKSKFETEAKLFVAFGKFPHFMK